MPFAPRAVTGHIYATGVVDKATGEWKWHRPDIDDALPGGNGQLAGDQGTAPPVGIVPDFPEDVSGRSSRLIDRRRYLHTRQL